MLNLWLVTCFVIASLGCIAGYGRGIVPPLPECCRIRESIHNSKWSWSFAQPNTSRAAAPEEEKASQTIKKPVCYSVFDDAVKLARLAGESAMMAKIDIKHAFRLCREDGRPTTPLFSMGKHVFCGHTFTVWVQNISSNIQYIR